MLSVIRNLMKLGSASEELPNGESHLVFGFYSHNTNLKYSIGTLVAFKKNEKFYMISLNNLNKRHYMSGLEAMLIN